MSRGGIIRLFVILGFVCVVKSQEFAFIAHKIKFPHQVNFTNLHPKTNLHRQDMHREKLRTMKPSIDTTEPRVLRLDHIRNNLKREQMLEERYFVSI